MATMGDNEDDNENEIIELVILMRVRVTVINSARSFNIINNKFSSLVVIVVFTVALDNILIIAAFWIRYLYN